MQSFDLPKLAEQLGPHLVQKPLVSMERSEVLQLCEAVLASASPRMLLVRAVGPDLAEVVGLTDEVPF